MVLSKLNLDSRQESQTQDIEAKLTPLSSQLEWWRSASQLPNRQFSCLAVFGI